MKNFLIFFFSELISQLGSSVVGFATSLWIFQQTGSSLSFSFALILFHLPRIFITPILGIIIDRYNRKNLIILLNLFSALASFSFSLILINHPNSLGYVYIAQIIYGISASFLSLLYSSILPSLLEKQMLPKGNAVVSFVESISLAIAPAAGGFLFKLFGLPKLMIFDAVSYLIVSVVAIILPIKQIANESSKTDGYKTFVNNILYGFKYILKSKKHLRLQTAFSIGNFLLGMAFILLSIMILLMTKSEIDLGFVRTASGLGGVLGSLLLIFWKGPKDKLDGVLYGITFNGIGWIIFSISNSVVFWSFASICIMISLVVINTSNQYLWQNSIEDSHRGRVFAARTFLSQFAFPLGQFLAGLLAEDFFESKLTSLSFSQGVGTALFIFVIGVTMILLGLGYRILLPKGTNF